MIYLSIVAVYALLMILAGLFFARRVKSSGDFYVAGRDLSSGLIFSTLLAANIGAGSTVGATGLAFRDGLSAWWWVGSAGIGSLILAFTIGPRIRQVAQDHGLLTVGDYLEYRYDRRVRIVVSLLVQLGSLAILAGQLIAIAWIFNVTAGISKPVGCLIGGAVATIYFTVGGLPGTARVNALQLVVKLVGFGGALVWLLTTIPRESLPALQATASEAAGDVFEPTVVWRYLALLVPSFIVSPGLLQKVFAARDRRAVIFGVAGNAIALLLFAAIPTIFGVIAHDLFPDLPNRELAMPTLLTDALPVWLGGLLLGALFAAEVSTADAVIFMLSTSLTRDLYQLFIAPDASDHHLLRATRLAAILSGAIAIILAIFLPTVIDAITIFYTLLTASLLLPLVGGLCFQRANSRAALASIAVSVPLTFLIDRLHLPTLVPPLIWALLPATVIFFALSSPASRRPA